MAFWHDRSPSYVSAGKLLVGLVLISYLASPITGSRDETASSQDTNLVQLPIIGPAPPDLGSNTPIPTPHQFVGFPFQDTPLLPRDSD
jgi:hypothetical protein